MSIVGIIIGICIVGIGIWNAQNNKTVVSTNAEDVQGTMSTSTPTMILTPTETITVSPYPTKTPASTGTKTPTPTTKQNDSNTTAFSISNFQYPGASVNSSSGNRLELATNDSTSSVTDWYKNKINAMGMNTKSFVTTSANDNIVNKLVAADGKNEIRVDITKKPSDSSVKIVIELK